MTDIVIIDDQVQVEIAEELVSVTIIEEPLNITVGEETVNLVIVEDPLNISILEDQINISIGDENLNFTLEEAVYFRDSSEISVLKVPFVMADGTTKNLVLPKGKGLPLVLSNGWNYRIWPSWDDKIKIQMADGSVKELALVE